MIKKYIPDFITAMNIVCGLAGVVFAFNSRIDIAFPLMIAAGVFDFFDGFAARALDSYSDLGKELDSLCDLVSFGVLPSVMLYQISRSYIFPADWVCWTPFLIAVFSAVRLAKFNVDSRQKCGFLGLPTPACALLCGALCYYVAFHQTSFLTCWMYGQIFLPVFSVVMSFLLVCELPMFSMKIAKDAPKALTFKRLSLIAEAVLIIVLCIVLRLDWSLAVLLFFTLYITKNVIYYLLKI